MKDYSNYYPSSKVLKRSHVNTWFYNMVKQSEDGCEPILNGVKTPCLIQQHTNPLDEYKEDRKLITLSNVIKRGDIVENYEDSPWLIITDVDLDCYYYTCKIRKCNNILKWEDKYKNVHECPCVVAQDTFSNTGIKETNPMVLGDGKLTACIQKNNITKNIKRDMRFIFEKYVYQVTYIDAITLANKGNGVIVLKMEEVEELDGDDFENQIANNSVEPLQIIIEGDNLVSVENTIRLNSIIKRGNKVVEEEVIWISNDDTIAIVDDKGLIKGVSQGQCKITCQLKNNPKISDSFTIDVIEEPTEPSITYELTTDFDFSPFIVPKGMGQTITVHKYNNKNEIDGNFKFELDLKGVKEKDVEFKTINNNQCYIKNLNIGTYTPIELIITDIESDEIIKKELTLKGLY